LLLSLTSPTGHNYVNTQNFVTVQYRIRRSIQCVRSHTHTLSVGYWTVQLIPILGSQHTSDIGHKPDGRLPLLSQTYHITALRSATNYTTQLGDRNYFTLNQVPMSFLWMLGIQFLMTF